jgi:hypothetical protein
MLSNVSSYDPKYLQRVYSMIRLLPANHPTPPVCRSVVVLVSYAGAQRCKLVCGSYMSVVNEILYHTTYHPVHCTM